MRRAEASKFQLSVLAAVLSALMLAVQGGAQVHEATAFTRRARALQGALPAWEKTLNGLPVDQASLPTYFSSSGILPLIGQRNQCLGWISSIRIVFARVDKNPALGQQFSLLSSLTNFDNALLSLSNALQLARTMEQFTAERATLEQDQEKVEAIREELQGFYADLSSLLFQRLRPAAESSPTEGGPASRQPGEISGNVYHADTVKPLADAVVTLESPTSPQGDKIQRTGKDGSYEFSGLAPGNYWVIAYRNGFVGSVHGFGASQNASKGLIHLAAGQRRQDVDFRLSRTPAVTTISGRALATALPATKASRSYGPGSFSPDGKEFAFAVSGTEPERICVYSLASRALKCVLGPTRQGSLGVAVNCLAWVGSALYAQNGGRFLEVTAQGTRAVLGTKPMGLHLPYASPPSAGVRAFERERNKAGVASAAGILHLFAGNRHFTVTAWYGQLLAMAALDGANPFTIATGGKELNSFVFDAQRSLVYYPVPGRYFGAMVAFDPAVRRYRTIPLPFSEGLRLFDVRHEGDVTLGAYTVDGPCVPKPLANGEDPWILPGTPLPARQPSSLCLATIPMGQEISVEGPLRPLSP